MADKTPLKIENGVVSQFDSTDTLAANKVGGAIIENDQTISANQTITSGRNGHSVGPITIDTGVVVTVPTGSRWLVD